MDYTSLWADNNHKYIHVCACPQPRRPNFITILSYVPEVLIAFVPNGSLFEREIGWSGSFLCLGCYI